MGTRSFTAVAGAAALLLIAGGRTGLAGQAAAAATSDPGAPAHAHSGGARPLSPELERALEDVRKATARFLRMEAALEAGWTEQYPAGCASSPEGGQGFHYLNPELVDGTVHPLEPELVMYEPGPDGSMDLVGVDYVIPFEVWAGDEPPTLLGQPLMRNEPLGVWAIHIWAWRANPSGMFAAWNPDVSCVHAR